MKSPDHFSAMPWQTYQVLSEAQGTLAGLNLLSRRWRFPGLVDWDRMTRAVRDVADRHPILTAVFTPTGDTYTVNESPPRVIVYEDGAEELTRLPTLDNTTGPVFVVRGTSTIVELWIQHSVCDAQSLSILADELSSLYNGLDLPPVDAHYSDYAEFVVAEARRQREAESYQRWFKSLAATQWPPPEERCPTPPGEYDSATLTVDEPTEFTSRLSSARVSPTALALHVATQSVSLCTGASALLLGVTSAIRPQPRFKRTVGDFANMLLVATSFDESPRQTQKALGLSMSHYAIYHPQVSESLGCLDAGRVRIDYRPMTRASLVLDGQSGEPVNEKTKTSRDLSFEIRVDEARADLIVSRRRGYRGLDFDELLDGARTALHKWELR